MSDTPEKLAETCHFKEDGTVDLLGVPASAWEWMQKQLREERARDNILLHVESLPASESRSKHYPNGPPNAFTAVEDHQRFMATGEY